MIPDNNTNHNNNNIEFKELLQKLSKLFESNEIDVDALKHLMMSYKSDPKDWYQYVNLSKDHYTRILLDGGNGKYNLMLLCWPPKTSSTIHNHPNSHCIMKILDGSLSEIRYRWPEANVEHHQTNDTEDGSRMQISCESKLDQKNNVAYINDSIGLHRVVNNDELKPAFSLHLYCPPFNTCRVFDEQNGTYRKVNVPLDPNVKFAKYRVEHLLKDESLVYGRKTLKTVLLFEKESISNKNY